MSSYGRSRANPALNVQITGLEDVEAMLAKWTATELAVRTRLATRAGAKILKGPLKAEAGAASRRMGESVYVHQAKTDRNATVVGHHRKKAFFWHMVIGGTKAHSLRPRKASKVHLLRRYATVRGVKANPIVARVAARHGAAAQQAMIMTLTRDL